MSYKNSNKNNGGDLNSNKNWKYNFDSIYNRFYIKWLIFIIYYYIYKIFIWSGF